MPLIIIKKVMDYCSYSKKYLAFIIALMLAGNFIQDYCYKVLSSDLWLLFQILVSIIILGYGMTITRDRINHGLRLPKIMIKDILMFGVKSAVVMTVYIIVQGLILDFICSPLNFPTFDLEDMLLNFNETFHLLVSNNPLNAAIYVIVGAVLFYVTAFFMEIALAKLADTNRLLDSFNLMSIKRSIDVVGWKHYTKDYTLIVVSIVILTYVQLFIIPVPVVDYIVDIILGLLIFATQFLGIGAVYCEMKDLQRKKVEIE